VLASLRSVLNLRVPLVWPAAAAVAVALLAWIVLPANRASMRMTASSTSPALAPTIVTDFTASGCTASTPAVAPSMHPERASTGPQRGVSLSDLVEKLQGGVVVVIALEKDSPARCGSGFFIDRDGLLLTSYHIVKDTRTVSVKMSNGAFFPIEQVIFLDPQNDVAALKVAGRNLPALTLGDSNTVRVGDEVLALGNPLGLEGSVSTGIISGRRREADRVLLQTTAPISPGNSGGPLVNAKGEVIGIIARSATEGQNLNFAVPINETKAMRARGAPGSNTEKALNAYFAGVLYANNKDYDRAKESLLVATTLDPANVDGWLELGSAYYNLGERDKEGEAYKKAVQFGPANDDAHFLLATWYEDAEHFGAASEEFRAAIRLNPKHQDALYELALLELTQGHRADAQRAYEQLKPLNRGLALKLHRILEMSGGRGGTTAR
jgi:S1-C subfamily serine protease